MEFAYDGGGLGKGGDVTLYLDGDKVGEGRVEHTVPMVFSADETLDLSRTAAPPSATTTGPTTASPAASAGSRSTSTRPPRTWTT